MRQKIVIKKSLQRVTKVYYKVRQMLQSVKEVHFKVRQVLQSVTDLLQSASGITNCDSCYKVRRNTGHVISGIISIISQTSTLWTNKTRVIYFFPEVKIFSREGEDNCPPDPF